MDELGPLIYGGYEDCLHYYAGKGLLASQANCNVCGTVMELKRRPSVKDQFSWRCTNSSCRQWHNQPTSDAMAQILTYFI